MKKYILFIVILSFNVNVFAGYQQPNICASSSKKSETAYCISMVELLANPEKYNGKLVSVTGFVSFEFEGTAIYLHKEDYEQMLMSNSYWLSLDESKIPKYNLKYANVIGRFIYEKSGHLGLWSGRIIEIKKITRTISKEDIRNFRNSK